MLLWLRRRQFCRRLAQADADDLIPDHGAEAYGEARRRERDVVLQDGSTHADRTPEHWCDSASNFGSDALLMKGTPVCLPAGSFGPIVGRTGLPIDLKDGDDRQPNRAFRGRRRRE